MTPQGLADGMGDRQYRRLLIGRLQFLEQTGLCEASLGQGWQLSGKLRATLQHMGRQGDIVRSQAFDLMR